MKITNRFKVISIFLLTACLISACAGAPPAVPATSAGSVNPLTHPLTYIGVIENIVGDQWTINGVTVTIDPEVIRGGPFNVGDQVKVEVVVNQDGSVTVSLVETPSQGDLSTLPLLGNDNDANNNDANANNNDTNTNDTNANDNGANTNDANNNDDNSNDDNGNDANDNDSNSNDDNGNNDDTNSNDDDSNSNDSNDENDNDDDDDDNNSGSNSNDDDDDD